jgi:hypothetical protein
VAVTADVPRVDRLLSEDQSFDTGACRVPDAGSADRRLVITIGRSADHPLRTAAQLPLTGQSDGAMGFHPGFQRPRNREIWSAWEISA